MPRLLAILFLLACGSRLFASEITPPAPPREFRGLWVATVNNVDWPSKSGLSTHDQQAELLAIFDRAAALHLNAIVFQVRPDCDALYESKIEPWSEYLTGYMGHPPSPYYDPLEFAVKEAHKRGLELHAWFNPFRVRSLDMKTPVAPDFVTKRRPEIVRHYVTYLWLDPGEQEARTYALNVIMDVVSRYDIDGVHFDDYFYPYRDKVNNKEVDFPDSKTWSRYEASGGKLSRNDWRRDNINQFIQAVYLSIKADKPWVKFGISPFGIWRPKFPPNIRGLDSYDNLYSDSRLWLRDGWVDYLSPQIYWPVKSVDQNFAELVKWWAANNIRDRNFWPGMKIDDWQHPPILDEARETIREIHATRQQPGATGNLLWHAKPLMQDHDHVQEALAADAYPQPALIPASPWLHATNPPTPVLIVKGNAEGFKIKWKPIGEPVPSHWVLEKKIGERWNMEIFPGETRETSFLTPIPANRPSAFALAAVDRYGNISPWAYGGDTSGQPSNFSP